MSLFSWKLPQFSKLSVHFFLNYLLLLLLLLIIGLFTAVGCFAYIYKHLDLASLNFDISDIYAKIESSTLEEAYQQAKLPEGSYIELIDGDLTVLDQYNSEHAPGFQYRQDRFNRILINYFPEYTFYYPDGSDTILLVVTPDFQQSIDIIRIVTIAFVIILISLVAAILLYACATSILFLRPINQLLQGVTMIRDGNYATRIKFKTRNELDQLMTAINQMAEKIQQEVDLRERSEKTQKQLILDISHDLKTPLTNIQGYSEALLQNPAADPEQARQHLEIIYNNSLRANTVLKDLFDLARLENSPVDPPLTPTDICEFMRVTVGSYIHELEANAMDYQFRIPDREFLVALNGSLMERAVGNLLTNSIKYAGKNTTLTVKVSRDENVVNIALEDNGPGIDLQSQDQIFLPFYRTDSSRSSRTGGTGLGLSISKAIIEKHHGTIRLDSGFSSGCRFLITLPVYK